MVGQLEMPKNQYHVRSTSLPSRSHPIILRVEEQWHELRTLQTSICSSSKNLCDGLQGLRLLYGCVDDLLQSTQTQRAIAHKGNEKWIEMALDGSLRTLDVCDSTRDIFKQMEESLKDLQSALRRRRIGEDGFGYKVRNYISSKKNMKKKIEKCLKSMKKMESKNEDFPLSDNDQCPATVIKVLREARLITINVFESILSFMSSATMKQSLVQKWMGTGRVACEGEAEKMTELERLDSSLYPFQERKCKAMDAELQQSIHKQFDAAIANIYSFEEGLDCLYKALIRTRVSILNISNH